MGTTGVSAATWEVNLNTKDMLYIAYVFISKIIIFHCCDNFDSAVRDVTVEAIIF